MSLTVRAITVISCVLTICPTISAADKPTDDPVWIRFVRQKWYGGRDRQRGDNDWPGVPNLVFLRGNHREIKPRLIPDVDLTQDLGPWKTGTGVLDYVDRDFTQAQY